MDLKEEQDKSGYTAAVEGLENMRKFYDTAVANLDSVTLDLKMQVLADLAEMNIRIKQLEIKLKEENDALIKYVDANNDMDFQMMQIDELGNLVAEELERSDTDAARRVREIMQRKIDEKQ